MKKILCVVLSLVLLISSVGTVAFAADETETKVDFGFDLSQLVTDKISEVDFQSALKNYNADGSVLPQDYLGEDGRYDLEAFLNSGVAGQVNMFGLSLDFLYNSTQQFYWTMLPTDADPTCTKCKKSFKADTVTDRRCPECGSTLKYETIKNDLTLAKANLNVCLLNILKNQISGNKLYSSANATKICNIIGHLLYEDFTDQIIGFPIELVEDNQDEFYDTIAERSGLRNIIQLNWCNDYTLNIKPLLYVLGVNFNDFPVLDRDIHDATIVSRLLLKAIVSSLINRGPVNYILDIVWAFSRTYQAFLYEPLAALFKVKISSGVIDEEEFKTFKGLLNLFFNNNNAADKEKLQFFTAPVYRFASSRDTTELFLYIMIYLNLVGKSGSNPQAVENIKTKIATNQNFNDTEKDRLAKIIDGLFCGNLGDLVDMLADVFSQNFSEAKDTLWQNFIKAVKNFLHGFVELFDRIYKNIVSFPNWDTL